MAIDTTTNHVVDRIPAEMPGGEAQVIAGDLWVTSCFEDQFVDIVDTVRPLHRWSVETGGAAGSVLAVARLVWITPVQLELGQPGSLIGVNPYTGQIVERLIVDDPAYTAAIGFNSVWMFAWEAQAVVRLPLEALRRNGQRPTRVRLTSPGRECGPRTPPRWRTQGASIPSPAGSPQLAQ